MGTKIESSKNDKLSLNANSGKQTKNAKPDAQSTNPSQALPGPTSVHTSAPKTQNQPNTAASDGSSSSKTAGNQNLTSSKVVYQKQRTALRLIKNIGQLNESERTDRQMTSFKWAMSVLAGHDTPADQKNSGKRQRSLEETSPTIQPVPKKL